MSNKQFSWFDYFLMPGILLIPLITYKKIADPNLLSRQIAYSMICAVAVLFVFIDRKNIKWPDLKKPFFIALLIWPCTYMAGLIDIASFSEGIYTCSKMVLYASGIYLFTLLFQNQKINKKGLNRAIAGMVWIALLFLVNEILSQHKAGVDLLKNKNLYQLSTVFSHKNLFSSALLLCFPFIFQIVLFDKLSWKIIAALTLFMMVPALLFIQTKAVLLAMLIALVVCFIPLSLLLKPRYPKLYFAGIFAFALGMAGFVALSFLYPQKFVLLYNNETFKERILLWQNTWQMIKEFPYMGVGGGNWQIYFPKYGLQDFMHTNYLISDGYTTFQRPHNDFLWVWSEAGPLGLIAYLTLFAVVIKTCFGLFKKSGSVKESLSFLSLFFTLIAYVVVAFFDFPLERNEHQLLLALLIGQVMGARVLLQTETTAATGLRSVMMVLVLLGASLLIAIRRMPGERSALTIIKAHAGSNWDKIISETPKCISTFYTIDNFSIPIYWYSGVAHFAKENLPAAKADFEKAYETNPYQVHVLNNIAGLYEKEGNHEQALKYYNDLLRISPTQPDALLNKSAVLFNMGKVKDAFACIYQFNYDEGNTQFLGYLNVIAKAYIEEKIAESKDAAVKAKWSLIASDEENIKSCFKYNKEMKHTYDEFEPEKLK